MKKKMSIEVYIYNGETLVSDKSHFFLKFQKDPMWSLSCDISYLGFAIDTKTYFNFVRDHTMIISVEFGFNQGSSFSDTFFPPIRSNVNIMSCSVSHWFHINTNIERVHEMIILVYCMGSIKFLISEKNIFFIFPYAKSISVMYFWLTPKKSAFYKNQPRQTWFLEDH